jgi:hypothetical protein
MLRIHSAKEKLGIDTPTVVWQFLVFRHNQHEVEIAKRDYKIWGADSLNIHGAFTSTSNYDKRFCEQSTIPLFEPSTIPQYNVYLNENPAQKAKHKYAKNRPCPWLYEAFVLNPGGRVSPCCAVWDAKDDFAEYSVSKGFFDAWNSGRFQRARKLFSRSQKHWDSVAESCTQMLGDRRDIGVSNAQVSVNENRLICTKCPMHSVPICLDIPEHSVTNYAYYSWQLYLRTRNIQYFFDLLLIILVGGPPVWKLTVDSLKSHILGFLKNLK